MVLKKPVSEPEPELSTPTPGQEQETTAPAPPVAISKRLENLKKAREVQTQRKEERLQHETALKSVKQKEKDLQNLELEVKQKELELKEKALLERLYNIKTASSKYVQEAPPQERTMRETEVREAIQESRRTGNTRKLVDYF